MTKEQMLQRINAWVVGSTKAGQPDYLELVSILADVLKEYAGANDRAMDDLRGRISKLEASHDPPRQRGNPDAHD